MNPTVTRLALGILASVAPLAHAAESLPAPGSSLLQMVLGLGAVLLCLFGALWVLRRLQRVSQAGNAGLRVISATSVGPRERVVLVNVADTVLVLGVAPGRVNALHSFPASALPAVPVPSNAGEDFAARLRQFMQRGGKDAA